ncbi:MAG: D-2-hydroxyacid dehydrogenase [Propionibacteriales bacterium]|nr:D-2-hydroxyacid dehydrogenase [Propionibacteriales bacterium]
MPLSRLTVLHDGTLPSNLERIEELADVRLATAAELPATLAGAEILLAWDFLTPALAAAWDSADRLRWVHTASAGVDNVLIPPMVDSDVALTNSRGVFDGAIAEYVLGLMLMFAKDTMGTWRRQTRREWEHRDTERLAGRTALVVGVGPIGRAIARLLGAAGVRVSGAGRTARSGDPDFGDVAASSDLTELVTGADYVVLVAPLTKETRGMIDASVLGAMKPSARLINVGRGELVVEPDLVAALRERRIAGAALDVFETEPLPPESPLWELPEVFVSPHMSADTVGWRDALAELFLDNLRRWRADEPLRNLVDKTVGYVRDG